MTFLGRECVSEWNQGLGSFLFYRMCLLSNQMPVMEMLLSALIE